MNFAITHLLLINVVYGMTFEDLENKANEYIVDLKGQIILSNSTMNQLINTKTTLFHAKGEQILDKIPEEYRLDVKLIETDAVLDFRKCQNCSARSIKGILEFIEGRPQGLKMQCRNLRVYCDKNLKKLQEKLENVFKNALRIIAECKSQTRKCLQKLEQEYSGKLEEIAIKGRSKEAEVEIVTSGLTIKIY